jgi:hypothetical protein
MILNQGLWAGEELKALIVDGQNNHAVWPKSTIMMRQYLEKTGLFEVDVARTRYIWKWEREKAFLPLANIPLPRGCPIFGCIPRTSATPCCVVRLKI